MMLEAAAFVVFAMKESGERAIAALHNQITLAGSVHKLNVKFAQSKNIVPPLTVTTIAGAPNIPASFSLPLPLHTTNGSMLSASVAAAAAAAAAAVANAT